MTVMGGAEQVGLDFNVGGNYAASLSQMIAQTDVYARSADTMIGKVALLNVGVTALVQRTNALTGANRIATAEAAAYQQRLAGIEGTARVTGQSFGALEKTTLSLGRAYGSIGTAVATVEALGASGVTSTKSIDALAKSWTALGVANQTSGVALGQTLLNLGRTFGNSEKQLQSYGDALTGTSKRYGASADAALSFAKALSPVAASVGMTESSVIGLGVAAARLGESGFAGANAFNKVLLDMGHSIRNGSPEIKEYAAALGMTTDHLRELFKADPTEVLVRFTEAIGKGGPQAMRTLESLGLDATRTVRAITALSSQGNLRQIINEATASYGGGDTAKAAAAQLDTVNHQMARLGETMSQTVSSAGKPFLGFLDAILKGANTAAGGIEALVSSAPMQGLGKVGAVASFGLSTAGSLVSTLGLLGLGRAGFGAARGALGDFRGGAGLVRGGVGIGEDASMMMRMGGRWGQALPEPLMGPRFAQTGARLSMLDRLTMLGSAGLNWASIGMDSAARMVDPLRPGHITPYSAPGQQMRAGMAAIWGREGGPGLTGANAIDTFGKRVQASARAVTTWSKEVTLSENALKRFGQSTGRLAISGVAATGSVVGGGVGAIGRGLGALGISPVMLGIGVGATALGYASSLHREQQAREEEMRSGQTDAWGSFNQFAAAAGLAGKGLVSLAEQIAKTTKDIANATKENAQGQISFTPEMAAQAAMPGYKASLTLPEGINAGDAATRIRLLTGNNPSPAALSTLAMDYASQGGNATEMLRAFYGQGGDQTELYRRAFTYGGTTYDWKGSTAETEAVGKTAGETGVRNVMGAVDVYGANVLPAAQTREISRVLEASKGFTGRDTVHDIAQQEIAAQTLATIVGGDEQTANYFKGKLRGGASIQEILAGASELSRTGDNQSSFAWAPALSTYATSGADLANPSLARMGGTPTGMVEAKQLDQALGDLTGKTVALGGAMYEAENAAKKYGTNVDELTNVQIEGMSGLGQALTEYRNNPTPQNLGEAAATAAQAALKGSGGSGTVGQALLGVSMFGLGANDPRRAAFTVAQQQLELRSVVDSRTKTMFQRTGGALRAGEIARGMGVQEGEDEAARQQMLQAEQEAYGERLDFQKQFVLASRNLDIQLTRQAEDASISRARAEEDYQKQVRYSTADFYRQRRIAERDFGISMKRAAEDSAKALYDPYQRIQAQMVWDSKSLLANLAEQNAAITKQTANVSQLRRLGLSRQAVDTLRLGDSANAQQVQRLLDETVGNPAMIRAINAMIAQRVRASRSATQNENNVDFRRATEDFNRSMRDSGVSFRIQMARMADSHEVSMSRMTDDVHRSRIRAQQDLARMGEEVSGKLTEIAGEFFRRVSKLPASAKAVMSVNVKDMMATAVADAQAEMLKLNDPAGLAQTMETLLERLAKKWGRRAAHAINLPGGTGGGTDYGPDVFTLANPYPGAHVSQGYSAAHPALDLTTGAGDADAGRPIRSAMAGKVSSVEHTPTSGGVVYVDHGGGRVTNYRHLNATTFTVHPGSVIGAGVQLGVLGKTRLSVSDPSRYGYGGTHNSGAHLHFAMLRSGAFLDPGPYWQGKRAWMKDGGIATRQLNATLGEAGHEAVLPLNVHGAKVLAETMVRYLDATKAMSARVAPYATTVVTSYSYDHSLRFTGPISVAASDPAEMGRRLEAKQRLDRLVQPVGR